MILPSASVLTPIWQYTRVGIDVGVGGGVRHGSGRGMLGVSRNIPSRLLPTTIRDPFRQFKDRCRIQHKTAPRMYSDNHSLSQSLKYEQCVYRLWSPRRGCGCTALAPTLGGTYFALRHPPLGSTRLAAERLRPHTHLRHAHCQALQPREIDNIGSLSGRCEVQSWFQRVQDAGLAKAIYIFAALLWFASGWDA